MPSEEQAITGEKPALPAVERPRPWQLVTACVAEAVGTALLVALSCLPSPAAPPLQRALAAAAAVATLVQCFDHISFAMFNPAVSLAGAIAGKISWRRAVAYCCAQLTGAIVGAAILHVLAGGEACSLCVTLPAAGVAPLQAAGVEVLLAAVLALANCAAWEPGQTRGTDSWPLRIGATVAALNFAAADTTGASMNPARSLGPALLAARWDHHWVYWVGPLGGAGVAAFLYQVLFACRPPPPAPRSFLKTPVNLHRIHASTAYLLLLVLYKSNSFGSCIPVTYVSAPSRRHRLAYPN